MKLPKTFVPEKNLETKTEELLVPKDPKKVDNTFTDYTQIRYTTEGTSWVIEYEKHKRSGKWVLCDKDFYENKWFTNSKLDETSKNILKNRIKPLVELLNLNEKDYSIDKDDFKSILDRCATRVSEHKHVMEDKEDGKCDLIVYEKGNLIIELRRFDRINLGRIDIFD